MNNLYTSSAAVSMRLLIILSHSKYALDIDSLTIIDFVSTYSKDFSINDYNLHGDSNFSFSEFSTRRLLVKQNLLLLLKNHFINISGSSEGLQYTINENAKIICNNLKSSYAKKYASTVEQILSTIKNNPSTMLFDKINSHILNNTRRGKNA